MSRNGWYACQPHEGYMLGKEAVIGATSTDHSLRRLAISLCSDLAFFRLVALLRAYLARAHSGWCPRICLIFQGARLVLVSTLADDRRRGYFELAVPAAGHAHPTVAKMEKSDSRIAGPLRQV
jgi:hypothetical protein